MYLDYLSLKWKSQNTNFIFGGRFQEDTMQEEKTINNSILKVNVFLAIAATLLSLIGMYNLVSLDIIRRTKEMGIRKIQGAPVPLIMYLMSKKFLVVLLIASVHRLCGWILYVKYAAGQYLGLFCNRLKPGILILAAAIMFISTILTIVFKIWKNALRNPVDSLRYE